MNRNAAGRKTKYGYVVWITAKYSNVIPDPFKRCNLVHVCIAAFEFTRMFFAQGREGKMAQAAKPVINGDQYYTLFRKCITRRSGSRTTATCKTTPMNPNHDWQL